MVNESLPQSLFGPMFNEVANKMPLNGITSNMLDKMGFKRTEAKTTTPTAKSKVQSQTQNKKKISTQSSKGGAATRKLLKSKSKSLMS